MTDIDLELSVRNGVILSGSLGIRDSASSGAAKMDMPASLSGRRLHELASWETELNGVLSSVSDDRRTQLSNWLQKMLPLSIY